MAHDGADEQQPVSFEELKRRWAQHEASSQQQETQPVSNSVSLKATSNAPITPSAHSAGSLSEPKGIAQRQPSIASAVEPGRVLPTPRIPPKPVLPPSQTTVDTTKADTTDPSADNEGSTKSVSLLAQQFGKQKVAVPKCLSKPESPMPANEPQVEKDIAEPSTLQTNGAQDPFCDDEMVTESSDEIDTNSDSGSISSGDSDVDEQLINQVRNTHIRCTETQTNKRVPVDSEKAVTRTPPPPPPPSKKYHRSIQQQAEHTTLPSPSHHSDAVNIPNEKHPISSSPPQSKPVNTTPPELPPRPSLYRHNSSRQERLPALPPRPSASTLARSHSIAVGGPYHRHNNTSSTLPEIPARSVSPPSFEANACTRLEDQQDREHLKRSKSTSTPSSVRRVMSLSQRQMNGVYPDFSKTSRNPPYIDRDRRIPTGHRSTVRALAVSGSCVATGAHELRVWNTENGQCIHAMDTAGSGDNNDKVKSLCFAPAADPSDDGRYLWMGLKDGELLIVDMAHRRIIGRPATTHEHAISFIIRHGNREMWTIDEAGVLNVWPVLENECKSHPVEMLLPNPYRVTPKATAALIVGRNYLWMSSGRRIEVYQIPSRSPDQPPPHVRIPNELGNITQFATVPHHPGKVFVAHDNGKVSVWDQHTLQHLEVLTVSMYGICCMICVGDHFLWMGYNTGMIYVYDTRPEHWAVVKAWKAHHAAILDIVADEASFALGDKTVQVVSVDSHGYLAVWDGLLPEFWQDQQMQMHRREYCTEREARVMICSWNIDANKPEKLPPNDQEKVHEWLGGMDDPDIIVVGIQEIVDLESKKQTARSLLAARRKIESLQEADELLTHRYTLWHDYLVQVIGDNYGHGSYTVIKTEQLVGLFSCIFVRTSELGRVADVDSTIVKTGMRVMNKSLHGNKGGIAIRFRFDHSSLCFVNCHLAAGQSHVQQRNADAEGILQTATFPEYSEYCDVFTNGGDGSMILDHEHCFLSGDLNYRIGMRREKVLQLLASGDQYSALEALQKEDQLLKQRYTNPLFKLLLFQESPIRFPPTYKYDPGTDFYDRSEKKRVPAWCDRILYRSKHASNLFYRRHEVLASDHRPISAGFLIHVKLIDPVKRQQVAEKVEDVWWQMHTQLTKQKKAEYVAGYGLCDVNEAYQHLQAANWDVVQVVRSIQKPHVH